MSTDETDDNNNDDAAPSPKRVVVTHYGKKKKETDVPSEIIPTEPTHIISSPVDIGSTISKPSMQTKTQSQETQQTKPPEKAPSAPIEKPIPVSRQETQRPEVFPKTQASTFEPVATYAAEPYKASQASTYDSPPPPQEPTNGDRPPSSGGGGGALFFSVISLFAVIILSYYAYSTYQQLSELQAQSQDEKNSVFALAEQTKKTLVQIQDQNSKSSLEQQSLAALKQQLMSAQANLVTLSGNTDWVLAEANYLAFMANERIKTAQDVTTALAQLTAADERISRLGNPALLWVRDVMAKDIAKLRNYPEVKRQVVWEQLGLIGSEFNQLHFKTVFNGPPSAQSADIDPTKLNVWQKALWHTWQELKGIIKVTHVSQNTIPLALTQQEQGQILRTLHFMNEQARWAILQGENKIYQNSLQSINMWLKEYFIDDKIQKDLLSQLAQLEQQNVNISLPDVTDSVQALSKAMIDVVSVNKPLVQKPEPVQRDHP